MRRGALETAGWLVLTLLAYLALGADVFYKVDGPDLLRMVASGEPHPWHVGYLPLLGAYRDLLGLVGVTPSPLRLGTSFSALGCAVGVAAFHQGLLQLQTEAALRRMATLLLAVAPPVLLFASVVEFHGPHLGAVAVAFWWTCVQVQRPTWWGMAVLAGFVHLAFLLHSTALFLPVWLFLFLLARRWPLDDRPLLRRRDLRLCVFSGLLHTALYVALPRLLPAFYGWHADWSVAAEMEASIGRPQSLDYAPEIFVQEWLLPVLPLSVACWMPWLRRPLRYPTVRLECTAFAIAFVPYWWLCVRQVVLEPEYGAYLLPLVPAAALLSAAALPPRAWPALLAASLLTAWVVRDRTIGPELEARYAAYTAELQRAAAGGPFLALVGRHDEMAICTARLPADRWVWVRAQATMPRAQYDDAARRAAIGPLRQQVAAGRPVLLTAGARAWLEDPAAMRLSEKSALEPIPNEAFAGPMFLDDLERSFRFEPAAGSPEAPTVWRLLPR